MQHAVPQAVSFAAIARMLQQPEAGIHCRICANHFSRIIPRAIVYDDNVRIPATLASVGQNSIQRRSDARALVIGGVGEWVRGVVCWGLLVVGPGCSRAFFLAVPSNGYACKKNEWETGGKTTRDTQHNMTV